jgi:hypothetical protein
MILKKTTDQMTAEELREAERILSKELALCGNPHDREDILLDLRPVRAELKRR